ncbi:putative RNA-dependent RNA polymerase 2 [Ceratocystis fimbriata CBS 114723]|uniref:RNA-dependent RNA polymerase n=1 Tax=Ceratocystis fimbriata CBS 114723 TaxID=1035309 RepID=A0A2C5WYJ0_9PEZI|nr:putative RNA-dependent RNA polymerase 2 [Ceratocystis fimbriata CBS 114723]
MEVILSNVPRQCPQKVVTDNLMPYLEKLQITEFTCVKMSQKPSARILFVHKKDAELFLSKFPATIPNHSKLVIVGAKVVATRGRPISDEIEVMHAQHVTKERKKYETALKSQDHQLSQPISMAIGAVTCGKCHIMPDGKLVYVAEAWTTGTANIKFGRVSMFVNFEDKSQMEIVYTSVWEVATSSQNELMFTLQFPPRFFQPSTLENYFGNMNLSSSGKRAPTYKKVRTSSLPYIQNHSYIANMCLVYKIAILGNSTTFRNLLGKLRKRDLFNLVDQYDFKTVSPPAGSSMWFLDAYSKLMSILRDGAVETELTFSVCFQLQAMVWNNYLTPDLVIALAEMLREKARKNTELLRDKSHKASGDQPRQGVFSVEAFKKVMHDIPYPTNNVEVESLNPKVIFNVLAKVQADLDSRAAMGRVFNRNMEDKVLVHKACVTPTRMTLHGPEYESKNRVLRKFAKYSDYFLRVQFCDEDGEDLRFGGRISNEEIMTRFKEVFEVGIQIAGRLYKFLGFSHSSLRSHSAWFSAAFYDKENKEFQTYQRIINSLGKFANIRTPARCAARIGQAFSETPFSVPLKANGIRHERIPDLKSPDGSRMFSDGVGTISYGAVEVLWDYIPHNDAYPVCFQVRWGGAKGMLALDSRIADGDKVFCVRAESMVKFDSDDLENLEICDTASRPLRLVLNRQMIKILEDMGVPNQWFIDLQSTEIDALRRISSDVYNTSSFLRNQLIGRKLEFSTLIRQLHKIGINYYEDTFMRRVVEMSVLRELRMLKNKARIPVRSGATLFGIVDVTGFLRENEIYVAIDQEDQNLMFEDLPAAGRVIVTRSPALHPGDIQFAWQRTPPDGHPLRELVNCVVFSQHGDRDMPSQLSGGDLDGDIYNVIWDQDLLQTPGLKTFQPADYPRVTPRTLDRDVTSSDMAEFFVDFMKTDQLGIIANRHQIMADQKPNGTLAAECLKLAEMHSNAVDFSKTGLAVDVNQMPRAPRYRPDFMAPSPPISLCKFDELVFDDTPVNPDANPFDDDDDIAPSHLYYESQRILGILYRNVDERVIWNETKIKDVEPDDDSAWNKLQMWVDRLINAAIDVREVDWYTKKRDAHELMNIYEEGMRDIMRSFAPNYMNPLSEVEVFCGFIFNRDGTQSRRLRDASVKIRPQVDDLFDFIVKRMRCKDRAAPPEATAATILAGGRLDYTALEMCLACFKTRPATVVNQSGAMAPRQQLRGFRVIAAACLLREVKAITSKMQALARDIQNTVQANTYPPPQAREG